ncbi:MAG: DUF962 domain-containing protein [Pseudomonadota bacterium]
MRTATDLLASYAEYHRDRRNIATHFVGIPMIVFAVCVLLARPAFEVAGVTLSPAWIVLALSALWWCTRGKLVLGALLSLITAGMVVLAQQIAAGPTAAWLAWGVGGFVLGWVIQFVGHYYEGRKPAFVDDLVGLLVGPMFVLAEAMFALGWEGELQREIERRAGPTHLRELHSRPAR